MNKTKQKQTTVQTGLERIEEIKSEIISCRTTPESCKAEVYDMWEGLYPEDEENS